MLVETFLQKNKQTIYELYRMIYKNGLYFNSVVPNITSYLPDESSHYVVNVTDDITFQCTATGVPPPDLQWYRGDAMLNTSSMRVTLSSAFVDEPNRAVATVTRELIHSDTSTSDAGTDYSCIASNAAMDGEDSEKFELFVQGLNFLFYIQSS